MRYFVISLILVINLFTPESIQASQTFLYQIRDSTDYGRGIWKYTGEPCNGDVCKGWIRLDNNEKTINIAAGGTNLYQIRESDDYGREIWQFTGEPCEGNTCAGWQKIDTNNKTANIVAAGIELYQLHQKDVKHWKVNDGESIWQYTGVPCNGNSCKGWKMLDNNSKTELIVAHEFLGSLFQLHYSGDIWEYTGQPCNGNSCVGWKKLDNNQKTYWITTGRNFNEFPGMVGLGLFQMHGYSIWEYTGQPCNGNSCIGWRKIDNNIIKGIYASIGGLYKRHGDDNNWSIWKYNGLPCNADICPGWQKLYAASEKMGKRGMVVSGYQLYRYSEDGIWRYTGQPCNRDSCVGWQKIDNKVKERIVKAGTIAATPPPPPPR